jgi:hypothetical protein
MARPAALGKSARAAAQGGGPYIEIGTVGHRILERGWTWPRNDVNDVSHFRKEFRNTSTATQEAETEIMGDRYIDAEELRERANQWRRFMIGEGPAPEFCVRGRLTAGIEANVSKGLFAFAWARLDRRARLQEMVERG